MEQWIDTPESSTIVRIGYDDEAMVMTVEFKSGGIYNYFDVPQHVFDGIRTAPSKGQFLAQQVKGNFRYART
jgi:KTSC domain-containing protein